VNWTFACDVIVLYADVVNAASRSEIPVNKRSNASEITGERRERRRNPPANTKALLLAAVNYLRWWKVMKWDVPEYVPAT
jgi:hypothetical protein